MMEDIKIHTLESAPKKSSKILAEAQKKYGFIPNLLGVLAESPAALKAYRSLGELFGQTSFSPVEQQAVLLATSLANRCEYCVAAHSAAAKTQRVPIAVVDRLRDGRRIEDRRLQVLSEFTRNVVQKRGKVSTEEIGNFLSAGFSTAQVFEVILGVAMKTLSNYANHIAQPPLDLPFQPAAWIAPDSKNLDPLSAA